MAQEMSVITFTTSISSDIDLFDVAREAIKTSVIQADLPEIPHFHVRGFIMEAASTVTLRLSDVSTVTTLSSPISGKYFIDCNIYNDNLYVPIDKMTVISGSGDVMVNLYYCPM